MNSNLHIQEASVISEIRRFADSVEGLIDLDTRIFESRIKLTPAISIKLNEYDASLILDDRAFRIDNEYFRIGLDPFNEWLKTTSSELAVSYETLNEGVWDSLKGAANWVGDTASKVGEYAGDAVKKIGAAALSQFPWGKKVIDFIKKLTEGGSPLGVFQLLLDVIGLIPFSMIGIPLDTVADALNAVIYFNREMYIQGGISLISCALFGDWIKGIKVTGAKVLTGLGNVIRGVSRGDKIGAQEAAKVFVKMEGASSLLSRLVKPMQSLFQGVKNIIAGIVRFLSKFLPNSWKSKIETFLINHFDKPMKSTKEAFDLASSYMTNKAFNKLQKADVLNGTNYAGRLSAAAKEAGKKDLKIVSNSKMSAKTSATTITDAATEAIKKHGYFSPKMMNDIVIAGPTSVKSAFQTIQSSKAFTKMSPELQKVVQGIAKDPKVFIEAHQRAKNLNRAIDAIMAIAKVNKKRKSIKVAALMVKLARSYYKESINCWEFRMKNLFKIGGMIGNVAIAESEEFNVNDVTMNGSDANGSNEPPKIDVKPEEVPTLPGMGKCDTIENQLKTIQTSEFMRAFTAEKPFGGIAPASDEDSQNRFEQITNPIYKQLGIEPVYRSAAADYPTRPIQDRVKYVEIFDESQMKISVPATEEEENQRYNEFLEMEVKKGELPREEIIQVIKEQRKKDGAFEETFNGLVQPEVNQSSNIEASPVQTHESFRLQNFKNFIKS